MAQRWFQRFNIEEENTKDLPRSGRPKLSGIENICSVLEEIPQNNNKKGLGRLSEELSALKDTIHRKSKVLGKSYRRCRSVPHEFTAQQARHKVDICRQLIGNPMDDRYIRKIVTCDEKWVYYCNSDASKQWLGPRQPAKVIVKEIGSALK